jgi:hypothetical protein
MTRQPMDKLTRRELHHRLRPQPRRAITAGTEAHKHDDRDNHRTVDANDWTPDHAVMSGTKGSAEAMPQFKYSDYN